MQSCIDPFFVAVYHCKVVVQRSQLVTTLCSDTVVLIRDHKLTCFKCPALFWKFYMLLSFFMRSSTLSSSSADICPSLLISWEICWEIDENIRKNVNGRMEKIFPGKHLNALNPNIKIQLLLCCPHKFILAVVGRSCENFKRIHLGWSYLEFSWPLWWLKHWHQKEKFHADLLLELKGLKGKQTKFYER